jgi:transcriptional regulator with XRE-family HTH domain
MQLGEKLKELRKRRGYTLQQLSEITGFSIGFLSNVERNMTSPTVSSLQKLCEVFNIKMVELIQPSEEDKIVVKKEERREIYKSIKSRVKYELLTEGNKKIQGVCITMEPGADYGDVSRGHAEEELGFVAKGKMEIIVEEISYVLNEGDTIYIESNKPHKYRNIGEEECICFFALVN